MKHSYSLVSATALLLVSAPACERSQDPEPTREAIEQPQTAREESIDEQRPGVQPPAAMPNEREPVAGKDEDETLSEKLGIGDMDEEIDVDLKSAEGMDIEGEADFSQTESGVKIVVEIDKAPPGKKGVHIHEKGDCSDIKGESMGGHFSPQGDQHALPTEKSQAERHLGDLGNIDISKDGTGRLEVTVERANLKKGDPMSFLGRAIVIHSGEDKGATKQPSGSSGTPMACAVIKD